MVPLFVSRADPYKNTDRLLKKEVSTDDRFCGDKLLKQAANAGNWTEKHKEDDDSVRINSEQSFFSDPQGKQKIILKAAEILAVFEYVFTLRSLT